MSYQPSSPKKLQHGGLGQTLQGAVSFTRSCPGEPFRGPCPGCFSGESPEEEKAGLRKEAQLTSLTADWRRWVLRTVEDCRVFALVPESLDELLPGRALEIAAAPAIVRVMDDVLVTLLGSESFEVLFLINDGIAIPGQVVVAG